jgi:hypothetical protein
VLSTGGRLQSFNATKPAGLECLAPTAPVPASNRTCQAITGGIDTASSDASHSLKSEVPVSHGGGSVLDRQQVRFLHFSPWRPLPMPDMASATSGKRAKSPPMLGALRSSPEHLLAWALLHQSALEYSEGSAPESQEVGRRFPMFLMPFNTAFTVVGIVYGCPRPDHSSGNWGNPLRALRALRSTQRHSGMLRVPLSAPEWIFPVS